MPQSVKDMDDRKNKGGKNNNFSSFDYPVLKKSEDEAKRGESRNLSS